MAASLQSPADITNAALGRIGYKLRVGSLFDGSLAAKKALDIYSQTRDELQRMGDWPFTEHNVIGNVLKQAPPGGYAVTPWSNTYPPLPWLYEYSYPSDCLRVRAVKPQSLFVPNFRPQAHLFAIANDDNQHVILSNMGNAVIVYSGQVTDPTQMPVDFIEAFIAALARRLAIIPGLAASPDVVKLEAQEEVASEAIAARQQG